MTDDPRDRMNRRWDEINQRLAAITAARATAPGDDFVDEEQRLLGELDRIEFEVGMEQRRADRHDPR